MKLQKTQVKINGEEAQVFFAIDQETGKSDIV